MKKPLSILLLAGSSEARRIGAALVAQGHKVRALKSEPPRGPNPMPVPFEVIDAPTTQTMKAAMSDVEVVVDASHAFDAQMTQLGHAAARELGLPFAHLLRALWDASEHPAWTRAPDVAAAIRMIEPQARVFSATGWASLPDYAAFPGAVLMLRQTTPHDRPPPYDFVELVFGTPPFLAADEQTLFMAREVDVLICRNLGARASRPKLDAAKALGLKVILIDPPPRPGDMTVYDSVDGIMNWIATQ